MLVSKIIKDIVNIKQEGGVMEDGHDLYSQFDFYLYGLFNKLVLTEYQNDKLVAFIEWFRIPRWPEADEAPAATLFSPETCKTAPILFINNWVCSSRAKAGTLLNLYRRCRDLNPDVTGFCGFRKKKNDKLTMYRKVVTREE